MGKGVFGSVRNGRQRNLKRGLEVRTPTRSPQRGEDRRIVDHEHQPPPGEHRRDDAPIWARTDVADRGDGPPEQPGKADRDSLVHEQPEPPEKDRDRRIGLDAPRDIKTIVVAASPRP